MEMQGYCPAFHDYLHSLPMISEAMSETHELSVSKAMTDLGSPLAQNTWQCADPQTLQKVP